MRSQGADKLVVSIIVSHGYHIDQTAKCLGVDLPEWCYYCATTSYQLKLDAAGAIMRKVTHAAQSDYVKSRELE